MFSGTKYLFYLYENGIGTVFKRAIYEFNKSLGNSKRTNPLNWEQQFPIPKTDWLKNTNSYLFQSRETLTIPKNRTQEHQLNAQTILSGKRVYFHSTIYQESLTDRWFTHPIDRYVYDKNLHWTKFNELNPQRDIKYIWENSRFCYLYDLIRYDYHFNKDISTFVLNEIESWIDANKYNRGPHFISSQEIGLRILNWLFAVYYYSQAPALTDILFKKIMQSIYEQVGHIANNLSFSQNFVRNNHIITETTAMFVFAVLFPEVQESSSWMRKSKKILESEINFQILEDGSYLQYSMNYHRIVVQLLTLNFTIAKNNHIIFHHSMYDKAKLSLQFLLSCTNQMNGKLPNYGANDGSLFFDLNNNSYTDFRPQLQALANTLDFDCFNVDRFEDSYWFGYNDKITYKTEEKINPGVKNFRSGGYFIYRDTDTFTFIRCGMHTHRPSQADNLHIDLWYKDKNIMLDGGTYSYNSDIDTKRYFFGTASHNTVMLNHHDQMLKGPRFIWYYKSRGLTSSTQESKTEYQFTGRIKAFRQTGKWQTLQRTVYKSKMTSEWKIVDELLTGTNFDMHQIWNPGENFHSLFHISAVDKNGVNIVPEYITGFYSESYGIKIEIHQIYFNTTTNKITTIISKK